MRTVIIRNGAGYTPEYGEPIKNFDNALGYLAGWALAADNHGFVEISVHSNGDMAAAYWKDAEQAKLPGRPRYMIFGQMAEDGSYSFHS